MTFSFQEDELMPVRIKVVGVGGAGCNAVNTMIMAGVRGVEFIAANTDVQHLGRSQAPFKVQLGPERTKGLGAGARPEIGMESALESKEKLRELLDGADMVFVTAGMGGRANGHAREGEGCDARARCTGGGTSEDAVDGGGEGVCV